MTSTLSAVWIATLVGLTAVGVASCGQPSETAAVQKEASNLGVRLCITNNSSIPATVVFTRKDTGNGGTISRGGTTCGEGTFGTDNDVEGGITWDSTNWKTQFSANNPWFGKPTARVSERDSSDRSRCLSGDFSVNESRSGDNGLVRMTLTRLGDGQWKEFTLRIDPSDDPDPSGTRRDLSGTTQCPGGTREHV